MLSETFTMVSLNLPEVSFAKPQALTINKLPKKKPSQISLYDLNEQSSFVNKIVNNRNIHNGK